MKHTASLILTRQFQRTMLGWLLFGALGAIFGAFAGSLTPRSVVVVCLLALVALYSAGGERGLLITVGSLYFTGFLRRISSGPSGYTANDLLALLPIVSLLAFFSYKLMRSHTTKSQSGIFVLLFIWTLLSGCVGILTGSIAAAYGLLIAVSAMYVGILTARGELCGATGRVLAMSRHCGAIAGAYGIVQWLWPPFWDLSWLSSRQTALVSVGLPYAGEFRVWGTAESPGAFATLLGISLLASILHLLQSGMGGVWARSYNLIAIPVMAVSLALTSVRAVLFALPISVAIVVLASARTSRLVGLIIVLGSIALALVLPGVLSVDSGSNSRYDLSNISNDHSFQERLALVSQFARALPGPIIGSGPGSSGVAARLDGDAAQSNVDNGYLARLVETGLIGVVLFMATLGIAVRRYLSFHRSATSDGPYIGVFLGIVVYFALLEISGPASGSLIAVFLWCAVGGLLSSGLNQSNSARSQMVPNYRRQKLAPASGVSLNDGSRDDGL